MNYLSPQQRKLVYLGGIVLLLIGTILLGRPSSGGNDPGGVLAQMRVKYELGESTLGQIDPSSAAMNLVLLGARGIAVNQLWLQHDEAKRTKQWTRMDFLANNIVALQPHFRDVWRFHSWDLAFNVSAEWDQVEDRYDWVKRGTKFAMRGQKRNLKLPELAWDVGRYTGHKIGRSDEWRFFRDFFISDPDPAFNGSSDPEINPKGLDDNYKVAHDWFVVANEIDSQPDIRQRMMAPVLFRHYPARALFDYADALHREGVFTDKTDIAWERAYTAWTENYGREEYTPNENSGKIMLESTEAELTALAKQEGVDPKEKIRWWEHYLHMTNYPYWRERAALEKELEMRLAHLEMNEGRKAFKRGDIVFSSEGEPPESVRLLESGMKRFSQMLRKSAEHQLNPNEASDEVAAYEYPEYDLREDINLVEEGMLALIYWRKALEQNNIPIPEDYPLKWLWEEQQNQLPEFMEEFERDLRTLQD